MPKQREHAKSLVCGRYKLGIRSEATVAKDKGIGSSMGLKALCLGILMGHHSDYLAERLHCPRNELLLDELLLFNQLVALVTAVKGSKYAKAE